MQGIGLDCITRFKVVAEEMEISSEILLLRAAPPTDVLLVEILVESRLARIQSTISWCEKPLLLLGVEKQIILTSLILY